MRLADLKIDDDFKNLLPELDAETYTALEKDIMANGMIDPIVIWNGYIADGHNRYSICKAHRVAEVETKELHKETKSEVMQWIVDHQFSKRNLKKSEQVMLLAKVEEQIAKEAEAKVVESGKLYGKGHPKVTANLPQPNEGKKRNDTTAGQMAKKIGVSEKTYRAMRTIVQKGTPEQIARMDKGGRGNSASAIEEEIKEGIPDGYRKCRKCGEVKTLDEFWKRDKSSDIYETICICCRNKKKEEVVNKNVGATLVTNNQQDTKKCSKCGLVKSTSCFSTSHGYITSVCKECDNKRKRDQKEKDFKESKIGKIISMLKDDERDTSNSKEDTKNEMIFLIEGFKSSFESILDNDYDKSDIEKVLTEHIKYLERKKSEL